MLKGIDMTDYKPKNCSEFEIDDDSMRINQKETSSIFLIQCVQKLRAQLN